MNFTDLFIRRPVFATVISLLILLVGAISYFKLPVRQYPAIDTTVISITTTYTGATAQLMEGFVTTPIENALSGIDGIDYMTASNTPGSSTISIHFKLGYDINAAIADVNSKVSSVRSQLPQEIQDPIIQKRDPNAQPSVYIAFTSNQMSAEAVTDYLLRVVQPQLATLPGVGQAQVFGEREYAMRIWLDPNLMAARGVTASDIATALSSNNLQSPTGSVESNFNELNVTANTDINSATAFNNMMLRNVNGQIVHLSDVGKAELGPESSSSSAYVNGQPATVMAITPQPTANPLDVSVEVNRVLNNIQGQLPNDLHAQVIWDNSKFIAASIHEVKRTVIETSIAVIIVMFLFLGSMRVLFIPAVTIPLSLIGVCALMAAMGFTINTLTLLALVLAIGMVVDDAIVVSENIHRHLEDGLPIQEASIIGAREIQFAIIAMTCTLAAVFAPIGFLTDITGALFKEFAFTLASAVVISGIIALTLSPMLCSKIMYPSVLEGRIPHLINRVLQKITNGYRSLLMQTLRFMPIVLVAVLIIAGVVVYLYKSLPAELAPAEDMGAVLTMMSGPPTANLAYMEKYTSQIPKIYATVPEKWGYGLVNGGESDNTAFSFLILKPWDERKRKVPEIVASIFPQLWAIPGIRAFAFNPFRLPGSNDVTPVKFVLKTTGSYQSLNQVMQQLIIAANKNPGLVNIDSDLKFDEPQIQINIDRNKAADLGIPISAIGTALSIGMSESSMGQFSMNGRSYNVIPELAPQFMNRPESIYNLNLRTASGTLVPLSNIVTLTETTEPESLNHFQQQRSASLSASLAPGYSLSQALEFLETTAKKIMPSDMQFDFSGTSRQFIQASGSMQQTFVFALLFIFLILAAQFESFLDPLIVMFSVIPAICGALIALRFTGGTMNIYTEIGLVTLVGLISKHGILMVEFANQKVEEGKNRMEAIIESATIRFRPILMTTACMVLGAIPLALATGAGALSRQQIGITIAGGMIFGTAVTLFVVPTAYITMSKLRSLFRRKPKAEIKETTTEEMTAE